MRITFYFHDKYLKLKSNRYFLKKESPAGPDKLLRFIKQTSHPGNILFFPFELLFLLSYYQVFLYHSISLFTF